MKKLTHLDEEGKAKMVDVSEKGTTLREAVAQGRVIMKPATVRMILDKSVPKGDVIATARIAGIMAAKRTGDLIPLCHPLNLTSVAVDVTVDEKNSSVHVESRVRTVGPTGVEMEALTAASVAALTVYDMCKAVDRGMVVTDLRLLRKSGGRSGDWEAAS